MHLRRKGGCTELVDDAQALSARSPQNPGEPAMRPHSYAQRLRLLAGVAMFSALAPVAVAGDNGRAVPLLPQYKQECDSCHIAYSPTLMPAASWKRLLGNLPEHFGTDASLDPATLNRISAWVNAHAGSRVVVIFERGFYEHKPRFGLKIRIVINAEQLFFWSRVASFKSSSYLCRLIFYIKLKQISEL